MLEGEDSFRTDYETLTFRFPQTECLYPMPKQLPQTDTEKENLSKEFLYNQIRNLKHTYGDVLKEYIYNCESRYNDICFQRGNITIEMADFIQGLFAEIEELIGATDVVFFKDKVKHSIYIKGHFKKMLEDEEARLNGKVRASFSAMFKDAFIHISGNILKDFDNLDSMSDISSYEMMIFNFASNNNISLVPNKLTDKESYEISSIEDLFGHNFTEQMENSKEVNRLVETISRNGYSQDTMAKPKSKYLEFILRTNPEFKRYVERNTETFGGDINADSIIAILNDTSIWDIDLIFTTTEVFVTGWKNMKDHAYYKDIVVDKNGEKLVVHDYKYSHNDVNMDVLEEMITELAKTTYVKRDNDNVSLGKEVYWTFYD